MNKLIKIFKQNCSEYLESKSIKAINVFFILSSITCLLGVLLLSFYNTYFISHDLYESSLIIFRTGLMVGLFPIVFALIIGHWKQEN